MHAPHHHLLNCSSKPEDIFLNGLETADRCRKYGVPPLRRVLLCAICLLDPGWKGARSIQLREALTLCVLGAVPTEGKSVGSTHQLHLT